jgi:hypothetical protein
MTECLHLNYHATWSKDEHKWRCMHCGELYECTVKSEYIQGVNPCCPDYPHLKEKSNDKG